MIGTVETRVFPIGRYAVRVVVAAERATDSILAHGLTVDHGGLSRVGRFNPTRNQKGSVPPRPFWCVRLAAYVLV